MIKKEWQQLLTRKTKDLDIEYQTLTPVFLKLFEKFLLPSWWVFLFLLLCYMAYEHSINQLHKDYSELHESYVHLQQEKQKALKIQEDYLLQINSQSDQEWIEQTLIKGLGLVPEEQVKVFFSRPETL